ncbi:MAG: alpha/beta hydrolase [Planctomycetes bacterium]|nr:alpha/beta hydrolase [Planctomycetota bacterium]
MNANRKKAHGVERTSVSPEARLFPIVERAKEQSVGDVVFVHGLGGDPYGDWGEENDSWLHWLDADLSHLCFYTLAYPTSKFTTSKTASPSLTDTAELAFVELERQGVGQRPLVFVTYSFGGLVVKQMLRRADNRKSTSDKLLLENNSGVVFIATPHGEAPLAALAGGLPILRNYLSAHASVIAGLDGHAYEVNEWYTVNSNAHEIQTLSFHETDELHGQVVVPRTIADPGVPGGVFHPASGNHRTVCKPKDKDAPIYKDVKTFIEKHLPSAHALSQPPPAISPREMFTQVGDAQKVVEVAHIAQSPIQFETLMSDAKERVFLAGQNLYFLVSEKEERLRRAVFKFLREGGRVEILICSLAEDDDDAVSTWQWVTGKDYREHLSHSHRVFAQWREAAQQEDEDKHTAIAERLVIKSTKFVPVSATIVDPDRHDGYLVVTPNVFQPISRARTHFLISKSLHKDTFERYWGNYEYLFHFSSRVTEVGPLKAEKEGASDATDQDCLI